MPPSRTPERQICEKNALYSWHDLNAALHPNTSLFSFLWNSFLLSLRRMEEPTLADWLQTCEPPLPAIFTDDGAALPRAARAPAANFAKLPPATVYVVERGEGIFCLAYICQHCRDFAAQCQPCAPDAPASQQPAADCVSMFLPRCGYASAVWAFDFPSQLASSLFPFSTIDARFCPRISQENRPSQSGGRSSTKRIEQLDFFGLKMSHDWLLVKGLCSSESNPCFTAPCSWTSRLRRWWLKNCLCLCVRVRALLFAALHVLLHLCR